jgi:hypothetical protein
VDERDIKGDGEGWACDGEGEREVCGGGREGGGWEREKFIDNQMDD